MADKVIKHSDVIEDKVFQPSIDSGEQFLKVLQDLNAAIKVLLANTSKKITISDPTNLKEYREQTLAINQVGEAYKRQTQLQAQLTKSINENVKAEERYKKVTSEQRAEIKQNLILEQAKKGSITALRAELSLVTKQWADLSEEERENGNIGKGLVNRKLELTEKLKKLEEATGDHRRSVGDYAKGLKGLDLIFKTLEHTLGVNLDLIRDYTKTTVQLLKGIKGFSSLTADGTKKIADNTTQVQKATAAQRAWNVVKTLSIGSIGLIIAGIAALGVAIALYVKYSREATEAELERQKAIDGTIIKDDELRKEYNKSIFELQRLDVQYKKLTGTISEFGAATELAGIDYKEALQGIRDETKSKLAETTGFFADLEKVFLNVVGQLGRGISIGTIRQKKEQEDITKGGATKEDLLNKQEEAKTKIREAEELERLREFNKELKQLQTAQIEDKFELKRQEAHDDAQFRIEDIQNSTRNATQKSSLIKEINKKLNVDLAKINKEQQDEIAKENKKAREEWLKENKKVYDQAMKEYNNLQKIISDSKIRDAENPFAKENLEYDERLKAAGLFYKKRNELSQLEFEALEVLEKEHIDNILNIITAGNEKIANQNYDDLKKRIDKEEELKKLEQDILLKEAGDDPEKLRAARKAIYEQDKKDLENALYGKEITYEEYLLRLRLLELDQDEFEKNLWESEQKEKLDKQKKFEEEILELSKDRIDKEKQLNADKISDLDKQIQTQTELALRGEKNTLAFLQKERAKALEEKAKLEKRESKRRQAEQLAELYLELYKVYVDKGGGKKGFDAAIKAGAETVAAKAFAEVIAGAFAEGVENLNGAGTETSDSNIALLSKGESVITAKATRETRGLATALNDKGIIGAKEWMLQNISIPQVHPKEEVNNAMMDMVYEQLQSLEKTIKNKKELIVYRNALGDLVREEYESGHRNVIIERKTPIIRRG